MHLILELYNILSKVLNRNTLFRPVSEPRNDLLPPGTLIMNPNLKLLQPYPFERLHKMLSEIQPNKNYNSINLSIGEPKHKTPSFIKNILISNVEGLGKYPSTAGNLSLRKAIANWLTKRYNIRELDPETEVLPVIGSREALFAFAQTVVSKGEYVICPNPFYQIYEGAALLAGAQPYFLDQLPEHNFELAWGCIPENVLRNTSLIYLCSPGNPTGKIISLETWKQLFHFSDQYGCVLAVDECYSEIYLDEKNPPLGALEAAQQLGRLDFRNLIVFSSLSKRSNAPGLRSGFVAGDQHLIKPFLLYRTYHGSAMNPAVQAASEGAWNDESHVQENRKFYREKFEAVLPLLKDVLGIYKPEAGFYLWAKVPGGDDIQYCKDLYAQYNMIVLPGRFLSRPSTKSVQAEDSKSIPTDHSQTPADGFIRIALVETLEYCLEAVQRIRDFGEQYKKTHY